MLVAKPETLRDALRTLELCAKANVAILPQGADQKDPKVPRDLELCFFHVFFGSCNWEDGEN